MIKATIFFKIMFSGISERTWLINKRMKWISKCGQMIWDRATTLAPAPDSPSTVPPLLLFFLGVFLPFSAFPSCLVLLFILIVLILITTAFLYFSMSFHQLQVIDNAASTLASDWINSIDYCAAVLLTCLENWLLMFDKLARCQLDYGMTLRLPPWPPPSPTPSTSLSSPSDVPLIAYSRARHNSSRGRRCAAREKSSRLRGEK